MQFKVLAESPAGERRVFMYDNETNTLSSDNGFVFEDHDRIKASAGQGSVSVPFDKYTGLKKSKLVRVLKIQLGLSCNYSCNYCSQRFVERADETSKKDVDTFMKKIESLEFNENPGLNIEIWGGEPLVYIKTIFPLVAALQKKFIKWENKPRFSMITNGSLLTDEICDWLYNNQFIVSISHDGPGQSVRGPDPFVDPDKKDTVLRFYRRMKKQGRISFNSMLNVNNMSRKVISDWFRDFTGDQDVGLGEGGIIDAYDADGLKNALSTKKDHFLFRQTALNDIFQNDGDIGFRGILGKIDGFTNAVLTHQSAQNLAQKCGMDDENVLAVDLRGNVITCQNVSAVSTSMNGMQHMGGNIANIDAVSIKTSTHWRNRPDCAACPVLHICQGACMFLDGDFWETSCNNAFSDAIPLFALSIYKITGYIPSYIEADHLPPERRDIWGTILEHEEFAQKDAALAMSVQAKIVVEGTEVYTKASLTAG
jgi:uncharacterized protein